MVKRSFWRDNKRISWKKLLSKPQVWLNEFVRFSPLVEMRFLKDLIVPHEILTFIDKMSIPEAHDRAVYRLIIAVSIFNGILIGLPGTLGMGVLPAQVLEIAMAVQIARMVGLLKMDISDLLAVSQILKLISAAGITVIFVTSGFKLVWQFCWGLLATLPLFGATSALAGCITTLFYGLFIYLAFTELKDLGEGKKLSLGTIRRVATQSVTYTQGIWKGLKKLFVEDGPKLFQELKNNVMDSFNGVTNVKSRMKGEVFSAVSLAYLLQGNYRGLEGPFGKLWLESWKLAFPEKLNTDSSVEDIKNLAESYNQDEFVLVKQNVTSKFYELLEVTHENADGIQWSKELIQEQNNPASDAIFFNPETGKSIEINYKFTENKYYIESHIQEYAEVPVVAPADVAERINHPMVMSGEYEYQTVKDLSEENFDQVLSSSHNYYLELAAAGGGAVSLGMHLLPFLVAYKKGKISREQLGKAIHQFIPRITARTVNRIAMLALLGPVYAMFLAANFGLQGVLYGFDDIEPEVEERAEAQAKVKKGPYKFSRRSLITLSFLGKI